MLLISLLDVAHSTTCNIFPKILGGSKGLTKVTQIDVYDDYLALAGNTWDNKLTGITVNSYIPILALSSISKAGKYYWAKA